MKFSPLRPLGLSLVGAVLAMTAGAAMAERVSVPFKATLSIREDVTFTLAPPCFAMGALTGSGVGAVLGAITASSQDCINPLGAFDPNAPSYHFASTPPGLVIAVPGGDQIFANYSGTLTYRPNAPHAVNGDFIITGGTGHFTGATGGGTLSGFEDIRAVVSGTGQVTFSGKILVGAPAR